MSKTPQDSTCLQMFHELDTLWMGLEPNSPRSGFEAYESLFDAGLHPRLRALAQRRDEFKARLTGDVRQIDNFAVTSGHEALAIYAERVAAFVGVRKSSIPLQREELDAARGRGNTHSVAKHEHRLHVLGENFVKTILSAFNGWEQHRAWIQRSIEQEQDVKGRNGSLASNHSTLGAVGAKARGPSTPTPRPNVSAIDATAKRVLEDALKAGIEAGEPYVPTRKLIAQAVGKQLNIKILVATLFGTKGPSHLRVPRYREFTKLWKQTMLASQRSAGKRASGGRMRP